MPKSCHTPDLGITHGLWDTGEIWGEFKSKLKQEHGYQTVVAWTYPSSVSFDQNKSVINQATDQALNIVRARNIVAKKADVVAHSMGGVLTKKYGHESYINSITTVGTPHFGSPFADFAYSLVYSYPDPTAGYFFGLLFELAGHPAKNGAIEDLTTLKDEDKKIKADKIKVPINVISGISLIPNIPISFIDGFLMALKVTGYLPIETTVIGLHELIFWEEGRSDWVVSETSQEGGWGDAKDVSVLWHVSEPEESEVMSEITNFLHRTDYNVSVSQTPLIQHQDQQQIQRQETKQLGSKLPVVKVEDSLGQLQIASPTEGQVFQPGDTVDVNVDVSGENATVFIATSTGEVVLLDGVSQNFQFVIPDEAIGILNILTAASNDEGFIGSDEVTINVVSSANLIDITIYPEIDPLYLSIGSTTPLTIYGAYNDGVTREITSSGSGTSYASSAPDVAEVSSEGFLTVQSQGEAVVTVRNFGMEKELTIVGQLCKEYEYYEDVDEDGYGNPGESIQACFTPEGYVSNNTDCDDTDAAVNPGEAGSCEDNISLTIGWNLISLPQQPSNTVIESILSTISGKYSSVWAFMNSNWKVYDPANPDFSDLLTMEAGWGYWIKMTEAASLGVSGTIPSDTIPLVSGWNLAGYNSTNPLPIANALASIAGKYVSVWAFIDGGWKVYDPANPDFSDLLIMEPDYGYWINTNQACSWSLP